PAVAFITLSGEKVKGFELPFYDHSRLNVDELVALPEMQALKEKYGMSDDEFKKTIKYAPLSGAAFKGIYEAVASMAGEGESVVVATARVYPHTTQSPASGRLATLGLSKTALGVAEDGEPLVSQYGGGVATEGIVLLSPGKLEVDPSTGQPVRKGAENDFVNKALVSGALKTLPEAIGFELTDELAQAVEQVKEAFKSQNKEATAPENDTGAAPAEQDQSAKKEAPAAPGKGGEAAALDSALEKSAQPQKAEAVEL
ncbi:hypothetical protein D6833_04330, partial [Candidatus Parcubacteria bacterium]